MSDAEKGPLEKKYQAEQQKYKKAMAKYKMTDNYKNFLKKKDENKLHQVRKSKFKKDENAPTRPVSAYMLMCADKRPGLVAEGIATKEIMSKLGKMWSGMSAA